MKYDILQLNDMLVQELRDIANRLGVADFKKFSKQDLIYKILDAQAVNPPAGTVSQPEILVEDNTPYDKITTKSTESAADRANKRDRKSVG